MRERVAAYLVVRPQRDRDPTKHFFLKNSPTTINPRRRGWGGPWVWTHYEIHGIMKRTVSPLALRRRFLLQSVRTLEFAQNSTDPINIFEFT